MSLFYQIIEEHKNLLYGKGYDEESLNSPDKHGRLIRQLELHFSKSLRDAHAFGEELEFDLQTIGFFNREEDIVLFTFNYEYNPDSLELKLNSIAGKMGMIQVSFKLTKNADLPSSTKLHEEVAKEVSKLENARRIANHEMTKKGRKIQ